MGTHKKKAKKMQEKKQELKKQELAGKGKLVVSQKVQTQINVLHRKVGAIEWCSILVYSKVAGDISDPSTLVLRAEDMYLMDIGTGAATDAKIDSETLLTLYERFPGLYDGSQKQGMIHTHHTMDSFFSGTDWSELNDNSPLHNYYLSFIVNFAGKFVAKVAYVAEVSSTLKFRNASDQTTEVTNKQDAMMVIDMDVELEQVELEQEFFDRYDEVQSSRSKKSTIIYSNGISGFGTTYGGMYGQPMKVWDGKTNRYIDNPNYVNRQDEVDYPCEWDNSPNPTTPPQSAEIKSVVVTGFQGGEQSTKGQEGVGQNKSTFRTGDTITYQETKEILLDWLNEGLRNEVNYSSGLFKTPLEGIGYFEGYFADSYGMPKYLHFLDMMQLILADVSKDYRPILLSTKLEQMLGGLLYFTGSKSEFAADLLTVAKAHPQFLTESRRTRNSISNTKSFY